MASREQQAKLAKALGLSDPKNGTVCPLCGADIDLDSFTDDLSRKEYDISSLCQACQDRLFCDTDNTDIQ